MALAKNRLKQIEDNAPQFSEQGRKESNTGSGTVATGIRTSAADRQQAMAKHQAALDAATAALAALEGEKTLNQKTVQNLETQYRSARDAAMR